MAKLKLYAKISRIGKGWTETGGDAIEKVVQDLTRDTLDAVLFESTLRVPVDTGQLRDSAAVDYEKSEVSFNATYAVFVHEGTGLWGPKAQKYPITAKNAKALRFIWPNAPPGAIAALKGVAGNNWKKKVKGVRKKTVRGESGYEFMFSRVMHPGQKGQPFLKEAIEAVVPNLTTMFIKQRIEMHFKDDEGEKTVIPKATKIKPKTGGAL